MSLIIGGISVGGALAAGAAGAVGTYAVGKIIGGGSSGGGGTASPAATADPFASQRPAYQEGLSQFMSLTSNSNPDAYGAANVARPGEITAGIPSTTTGGALMQQMLTPGYKFDSTDPSYAFRFNQGAGALASSNAAKGLLNSGAAALALTDYGQNSASQEYAAQFGRASAQDTSQQRLQQNQFADQYQLSAANAQQQQQYFSNLMGLNANYSNSANNLYTRLSQLAGANIGSPAQAGMLQQQQNAATAAGVQQIIDPVTGAIKQGIKNAWGGNSSASGGTDTLFGAGGFYSGTGGSGD